LFTIASITLGCPEILGGFSLKDHRLPFLAGDRIPGVEGNVANIEGGLFELVSLTGFQDIPQTILPIVNYNTYTLLFAAYATYTSNTPNNLLLNSFHSVSIAFNDNINLMFI
jgi:hypothetical protein